MNTLNIAYTKAQEKVFFESKARFKTIAKGRRLGFTRGCANYVIECLLDDDFNIISQGWHACCGQNHAERNAILSAKESLKGKNIIVNK